MNTEGNEKHTIGEPSNMNTEPETAPAAEPQTATESTPLPSQPTHESSSPNDTLDEILNMSMPDEKNDTLDEILNMTLPEEPISVSEAEAAANPAPFDEPPAALPITPAPAAAKKF